MSAMLSDDAIEGAEILAKKLGYLRNGEPNKSAAINYVLEAVHWILKSGGQFTMDDEGKLHLKSEKMNQQKNYELVIFDKDGTLTETVSGEKFVQHPKDQDLRPGIGERLERLRDGGVKVAIATNQGGVAAGYKSLDEAAEELRYCIGLIPAGLYLVAFMATDLEGLECWEWKGTALADVSSEGHSFRKPAPGMLKLAMKRHGIMDPSKCLMIGDRPEDEQAAIAAGMDFEWA